MARVDAADASPGQITMACDLYGHLPRLQIVASGVVAHLQTKPRSYEVLYSVFGAVDFTEPRALLPTAYAALKPGGRLVFSTLAHFLSGDVAEAEVVSRQIAAKSADGEGAWMPRRVLREQVWTKLLDEAGFTGISVQTWPAADGPRPAATLLVSAICP
ncbi:hypothetical protein [Streptomyces sp. NPDC057616]|uniref:hypothetical protein n=1 Tax=Streptomyces sp. NPDC057616 TaxID=3346183 RepID=UPI00369A0285